MSITQSVCVFVALSIQNTMHMSHIVICGLHPSSTLSHKRHDFREKKLLNIKCVFWFFLQLILEKLFILRTQWDMIRYAHRSSSTVPFTVFHLFLISRPEVFYRLWCVVVCDLETSWMRRPWPKGGCSDKNKDKKTWVIFYTEDGGNSYRRSMGKFLLH